MARYTDPDTWKTGSDPMTFDQWAYIRDMTIRLGLPAQVQYPRTTKAQAARVIQRLKADVKRMREEMW